MVPSINHPTMNRVPTVFRDRVAEFWNCCDRLYCDGCQRQMPDCEWTRISRKRRIEFCIGTDNGKWNYGFENPEATDGDHPYLSMAELKNFPTLKNVVIVSIEVFGPLNVPRAKLIPLDVNMEVLLKFVSSLSNEPSLAVDSLIDAPEGSTLLQWLEKMYFSKININAYEAKFNRLLERQYSRRKATTINIVSVNSGEEFLGAELAEIRIKNCYIVCRLSPCVVEAIVRRFLEDPLQFSEDYHIECYIANGKMKKILRSFEEKNQCTNQYNLKFTFQGLNGTILIVESEDRDWWSLRLCVQSKNVLIIN